MDEGQYLSNTDSAANSHPDALASTNALKIFISYSRTDLKFVEQLQQLLHDWGYQVLWDRGNIAPAIDWLEQVNDILQRSDKVICVISNAYLKSKTCQQEHERSQALGKTLIPLLLEAVTRPVPEHLSRLNYIHFYSDNKVSGSGFYSGQNELAKAVAEEQQWLRQATYLREQAQRWHACKSDDKDHGDANLLRGVLLEEAFHWLRDKPVQVATPQGVESFLQASQSAQDQRRAKAELQIEEQHQVLQREIRAKRRFTRLAKGAGAICSLLLILAVFGNYYAAQKSIEASEKNAAIFARESHLVTQQGDPSKALMLALSADPAAETGVLEPWLRPQGYPNARNALVHAFTQNHLEAHIQGHGDAVTVITIATDGNHLLTGSRDGSVKLWTTTPRLTPIQSFIGHQGVIAAAAFHPDGKHILTAAHDRTIKLWRIGNAHELQSFTGHNGSIYALAIHPDGKHFLSGSYDQSIKLWEMGTAQAIQSFHGHLAGVTTLSIHPNGQHFLSGSYDRTIKLWQLGKSTAQQSFHGHRDTIKSLIWHPDGTYFLSGSSDHSAKLWRIGSVEAIQHFGGHTLQVNSLAFEADGAHLWTGSADQVRRWRIGSDRVLQRFSDHRQWSNSIAFAVDNDAFYTGADGGELRRWRLSTATALAKLDAPVITAGDTISYASINQDKQLNLLTAQESQLQLWQPGNTGASLTQAFTTTIQAIALSTESQTIAIATKDEQLHVRHIGQTAAMKSIASGQKKLQALILNQRGNRLLSSAQDKTLKLWSWPSMYLLQTFTGHNNALSAMSFSPRGDNLVSADSSGVIYLWRTDQQQIQKQWLDHNTTVSTLTFLADSTHFISAATDDSLKLWDLTHDNALRSYINDAGKALTLAPHPEENYFLSGHEDGSVQLWQADEVYSLYHFQAHQATVSSLAFSLNGREIISAAVDGSAAQWHVPDIIYANVKKQTKLACAQLEKIGLSEFSMTDKQRIPVLQGNIKHPCR